MNLSERASLEFPDYHQFKLDKGLHAKSDLKIFQQNHKFFTLFLLLFIFCIKYNHFFALIWSISIAVQFWIYIKGTTEVDIENVFWTMHIWHNSEVNFLVVIDKLKIIDIEVLIRLLLISFFPFLLNVTTMSFKFNQLLMKLNWSHF